MNDIGRCLTTWSLCIAAAGILPAGCGWGGSGGTAEGSGVPGAHETAIDSSPMMTGRFTVQVAAVSERAAAESLVSQLRARGFSAFIDGNGEGFYRVRVGQCGTRGEAASLAASLGDAGYDTWIISRPAESAASTGEAPEVSPPERAIPEGRTVSAAGGMRITASGRDGRYHLIYSDGSDLPLTDLNGPSTENLAVLSPDGSLVVYTESNGRGVEASGNDLICLSTREGVRFEAGSFEGSVTSINFAEGSRGAVVVFQTEAPGGAEMIHLFDPERRRDLGVARGRLTGVGEGRISYIPERGDPGPPGIEETLVIP